MSIEYTIENSIIGVPQEPTIDASEDTLEALGCSTTFLFDLDDTISLYDQKFITQSLFDTLRDHTYGVSNEQLEKDADSLCRVMHYGHAQKVTLETYFDDDGIRDYWRSFSARFHANIKPEHVFFDPRLIKFINFLSRNSLEFGVISNAEQDAGERVLGYLKDESNLDLLPRAVFLGSAPERKPNAEALEVYKKVTSHDVNPKNAAYIGNSMSDVIFAANIGSVPVLLDPDRNFRTTELKPMHTRALNNAVQITDFAALKNYIERVRPNYRRQVSFLVNKALSKNENQISMEDICIEPTEENIFRIANDATEKVVSHIPGIVRRFHDRFKQSDERFSVLKFPNYMSFLHEATGAIRIPHPENIQEAPYKAYFNHYRYRLEGDHVFARGPHFYRQYIEAFKLDRVAQNQIVYTEIQDSLRVLRETDVDPIKLSEYLMRLAVMDNLRGNLQSLFLSTINVHREAVEVKDERLLSSIFQEAEAMYETAVELQYGFMLGLATEQEKLLNTLDESHRLIEKYEAYQQQNDYSLKHKSPEIDHQMLIAMRAHELCMQYPETEVLLGLSSGGVELAAVSKMLYGKLFNKAVQARYFPISTHHGLSMWQIDKPYHEMDVTSNSMLATTDIKGRSVVICEDNSNSGQTLKRVLEATKDIGAKNVHFAVIEIDPTRIILHSVQQKAGAKHDIGETAKRVRPVANYYHPDFVGAVSVVKILPGDQSFSKIIAMDTANKISEK